MKKLLIIVLIFMLCAAASAENLSNIDASAYEVYMQGTDCIMDDGFKGKGIDTDVLSGTTTGPDTDMTSISFDPNCISDTTIRELGESGRICEVFGHQWQYIPNLYTTDTHLLDRPPKRKCGICGKVQHWSPWEDTERED